MNYATDDPSDKFIDVDRHKDFNPSFMQGKKLIVIPSQGFPGTKVFEKDKYLYELYEHRMEAEAAVCKDGVFVTSSDISPVEDKYRSSIFDKKRPRWLRIAETSVGFPRITLDAAILAQKATLDNIKRSISPEHILYGYHQTENMKKIAQLLDIPFYGNVEFAMYQGGKIGMEEFAKEIGIDTPATFPIKGERQLRTDLKKLLEVGYDEAVIKVTHSLGGVGHKQFKIKTGLKAIEEGKWSDLLPKEFNTSEGGVLQGWINHKYIEAFLSVDILVDFDSTYKLLHAKTRWISGEEETQTTSYTPIVQSQLELLLPEAKRLAEGYIKNKAYGPHCANFIVLSKEGLTKYKMHDGTPIYHDENVRPGAGKMAQSWIQLVRNGKTGVGWKFKIVNTKRGLSLKEIMERLESEDLLIKECSPKAHGCIFYNGTYVDLYPQKQPSLHMITFSKNDDTLEAARMMTSIQKILNT